MEGGERHRGKNPAVFLVKVLNFFAWDVLNIMRKVEYEKLNRNRIDFENGIWYIRVKIQKFNRERK